MLDCITNFVSFQHAIHNKILIFVIIITLNVFTDYVFRSIISIVKRGNPIKEKEKIQCLETNLSQRSNDALFDANKFQDKNLFNQLACYMVKYYTQPILEYGLPRDRAVLVSMVNIIMLDTMTRT